MDLDEIKSAIQNDCYSFILALTKETYLNEVKRESSIIEQAGRMQAAFSFVITTLFVLAQILIEYTILSSLFYILSLSSVSFALLSSLICATLAQRRARMTLFPSVTSIRDQVLKQYKSFATTAQQDAYLVKIYEKTFRSLEKTNNQRVRFIWFSMLLFYVAIALCLFWFVVAIIKYKGVF